LSTLFHVGAQNNQAREPRRSRLLQSEGLVQGQRLEAIPQHGFEAAAVERQLQLELVQIVSRLLATHRVEEHSDDLLRLVAGQLDGDWNRLNLLPRVGDRSRRRLDRQAEVLVVGLDFVERGLGEGRRRDQRRQDQRLYICLLPFGAYHLPNLCDFSCRRWCRRN
jgi:hypothetical protein